eukprot:CAMPEP_0168561680 /NCGR_PEP_ID=MMETSP0413-20121227/11725_1 /TAXON_ID=136452 /ORGANISM="Filamoeba nolandi, Strain NC-AS-23-1" /LENGTH=321 /DNA_ID=CAMNT_0008593069 /DNA_START=154 /DNA_END=1119 /DNA_ORIENTATION=+
MVDIKKQREFLNNYVKWLSYIAKQYDFARLLEEYNKMRHMNVPPNFVTFSILILNACKKGDIPVALQLLENLEKRKPPNAAIYNAFIKAFLDQHSYSKALEFYQRMQREQIPPDSSTYKLLLTLFSVLQDGSAVKKIAQEVLQSKAPQLQTLVSLITACIIIHDDKLARDGLRRLISSDKVTDAQSLFTPILTAAAEHDQVDTLTLCLAILKNKFQTQPEEHLLVQILNMYVKNSRVKESIDILFMIEGFQWTVQLTTNFFALVTSVLHQKPRTDAIQAVLEEIQAFKADQKDEDSMATLRSRSFNQFRDIITKIQAILAE